MKIKIDNKKLFFTDSGQGWSRQDILQTAVHISRQMDQSVNQVLIQSDHEWLSSVYVLTAWLLDAEPILDPKSVLDRKDFPCFFHEIPKKISDGDFRDQEFELDPNCKVVFSTSGSTGSPKLITRRLEGLLHEVDALSKLFSIDDHTQIASLIATYHVYGFIHAFLLPMKNAGSISFYKAMDLIQTKNQINVLLSVPAQWSAVKAYLVQNNISLLVSSGAALGAKRQEELQSVGRSHCAEAIEILGSTETGGIAYRSLFESHSGFSAFEGVQIDLREDASYLESRFAPELKSFRLPDRLKKASDGRFYHEGRLDRVFKYSGSRYNLRDVEKVLEDILSSEGLFCHFVVDENRAKGGQLIAWIEIKGQGQETAASLRENFKSRSKLPCPDRFIFIDSLPRDRQGKIQLKQLLQNLL